MTRKRLFEIAEETKEIEDWIIAVSGVDKLCFGTSEYEETGFIINTLLPFLRDNEEWRIELGAYLEFKNIGCYNPDNQGFTLYGDGKDDWFSPETQMLLGYELEFCREILKQEETK